MSTPAAIDLDALAAGIADSLQDPTYALAVGVAPDPSEGFARFDTVQTSAVGVDEVTIRATVNLVSDGEDEIEGAAGETFEIVVRRVS